MTEQEQIDGLKRVVLDQGAEIAQLQHALGMFSALINEPPSQPHCGKCGMQMYDGAQCGNPTSECPCGIGVQN